VRTRVAVAEPEAPRSRGMVFAGKEGVGDLDLPLGPGARIVEGAVTRTRAELIVEGGGAEALVGAPIDVTRFGSPVRSVSTFHDARAAGRVIIVVQFIAPATPSVRKTAGGVRWHFSGNDMP
jgi:hypothetical protein